MKGASRSMETVCSELLPAILRRVSHELNCHLSLSNWSRLGGIFRAPAKTCPAKSWPAVSLCLSAQTSFAELCLVFDKS